MFRLISSSSLIQQRINLKNLACRANEHVKQSNNKISTLLCIHHAAALLFHLLQLSFLY
jgi:hypothetical protein